MESWQQSLINESATLKDALAGINSTAAKILFVVDSKNTLLGSVTDGDIRRALLAGLDLESSILKIMYKTPFYINVDGCDFDVVQAEKRGVKIVPLVKAITKEVVGMERIEDIEHYRVRGNAVVIMAGGLGSRLGSLTKDTPKPMLTVGEKPILEHILLRLKKYGFRRFYISVNYKSEVITDYFSNGEKLGIEIHYIRETERLGTAGSLRLFSQHNEQPFLVMNGDIISDLNFGDLLNAHTESKANATLCLKKYRMQIPYGVIQTSENGQVTKIEEKPVHEYSVSAGIYVFNPSVLNSLPVQPQVDMPELIHAVIESKSVVVTYDVDRFWVDIGRTDDYLEAGKSVR